MIIPPTVPIGGANIWLHVGTLLDGTSTTPGRDAHVVYNGTEIQFVGTEGRTPPASLLRPGQTQPDADAPDGTLLPGLIEAHAHLFLEGGELNLEKRAAYLKQSPVELLACARGRLEKLVRLGIAGVRDAGDKDGVGLALSTLYKRTHLASAAGIADPGSDAPGSATPATALMPYVDSPGAAIHHQGRYGSFMADALENYASPQACVAARVAAGADRIKLIPTGIINFKKAQVTSEPQMSSDEVAQLVAAAHSFGRQTFAHASGDIGIERVIAGGVDSVEHGFFVRDDQLAQMRDSRTAWVPTFAPVQEQVDHADLMGWDREITDNLSGILERHAASLVRAHALGVLIVAGSDAGSVGVAHGFGLLNELELMERAGLPPITVINATTGVSAERFDYKEKLGRIAPGFRSRFILTAHSPLRTVANLRQPRVVVFDGQVFQTGETTGDIGL
jgi:imidazolonepropionase-like amidohydrolase